MNQHSGRTTLGFAALAVYAASVFARTIDTDTVYSDPCPPDFVEVCGEPLRVVDGDTPPTVLAFVEPGRLAFGPVFGGGAVWLEGRSVMNMSGGGISVSGGGAAVHAADQSTVNMTGGSLFGVSGFSLLATDQAQFKVTGGRLVGQDVQGVVTLRGEARGEISSATVLATMGRPIVVGAPGHLTITGGDFRGTITAEELGTIDVSGGSFEYPITGLRLFSATDQSTVNIYGGAIPSFHEGQLAYPLEAIGAATVNVYGTDLVLGPGRRLTGVLADGTPIDVGVVGNVVLHEIPEPSSLILAALGIAAAASYSIARGNAHGNASA